MHSRSPDWVFGEVRLISSTRTTFAKTGPGWNSKRASRWLKTLVPTTSDGQKVGGALDAGVLGLERAGQRSSESGLADPWVVLDQDVPLGEERNDQVAHHIVGDLDRPADVFRQGRAKPRDTPWIEIRHIGHSKECYG